MLMISDKIADSIKGYGSVISSFQQGLIEPTRFKAYRVPMGVYEERNENSFMVRTRIPAGFIDSTQFRKIIELSKLYANGGIHFTTRQDIQFHKVSLNNTIPIIYGLLDVGIMTKGTGGNTPRNVVCTPLAGTLKQEAFDITPYAIRTTEYLLEDETNFNLPRKFKIAFASHSEDETTYVQIADLGFAATTKNNEQGFILYAAGGLGSGARAAIKLYDFIPAKTFLYHVQAMKQLFDLEGDRKNRSKARIRHILTRLGESAFKKAYQLQLNDVKKNRNDLEMLGLKTYEYIKNQGVSLEISDNRVIESKIKGRYNIEVQAPNGNFRVDDIKQVLDYLDKLPYSPSIRVSNTQGFYIREIDGKDVADLIILIDKFASKYNIDKSIACAGASTCKLGLCLSQNLSKAINEKFSQENIDIKESLPRIYISGCPNSCGQHQVGEIGFCGNARRVNQHLVPTYKVLFGAGLRGTIGKMTEVYGELPAKAIPEFLNELAVLKLKSKKQNFSEFLQKHDEAIKNLINIYKVIPSIEDNIDYYKDFGKDELFSLKGRGVGECSIGVLDVIKSDIKSARTALDEGKKTNQPEAYYDAALAAAKSLLILNGHDDTDIKLVVSAFDKYYIKTGWVLSSVCDLLDDLVNSNKNSNVFCDKHKPAIKYLVERMIALYDSLDSKLSFTLEKESQMPEEEVELKSDIKLVDLRGVKCPINFVKCKIEIQKIAIGESLKIYLDDGEPISNVSRSIEIEGHQIVSIDENYDGYNLLTIIKR